MPSRAKVTSTADPVHRSVCPIACTLDLLGDKWTLLVIRDLLFGKAQFKEFMASPEGIATNILADRLARLTENQLIERFAPTEASARDSYRLTAKGRSLAPVIDSVAAWGLANISGTDARLRTAR